MLLSGSCLQNQILVAYRSDNPILIDFIGIKIASGSWTDVFRTFSRRMPVLFPCANHPVIDLKPTLHDRLRPVEQKRHIFVKEVKDSDRLIPSGGRL
jgi:hypothetical protein